MTRCDPKGAQQVRNDTLSRNDELDAMDLDGKKADLLSKLESCDFLRFDRKPQLAFWGEAISALEDEGKIETEFREVDEQYSYLRVTLPKT